MLPALAQAQISRTSFIRDVYEPSDDSFALVDALQNTAANWLKRGLCLALELGSGSGFVISSIALLMRTKGCSAHCMAVDINTKAADATHTTLAAHQVHSVDVVCMDMLLALSKRLCQAVDLLVFNPPYVPTPIEEISQQGIAQSWAGGPQGRYVINKFLPLVKDLLSPTGQLFLVTIAQNDPSGILKVLEADGIAEAAELLNCSMKLPGSIAAIVDLQSLVKWLIKTGVLTKLIVIVLSAAGTGGRMLKQKVPLQNADFFAFRQGLVFLRSSKSVAADGN